MMMFKKLTLMAVMMVPAMMAVGCGSSTSVRFDGYTVASLQKKNGGMMLATTKATPLKAPSMPSVLTKALSGLYESLVPEAKAAVSSANFCFKRIRVMRKGGNNSDGDKNYDVSVGMVTMNESGTDLTEVELESGEYKRVEFDIKDECGTGYSVSFTNGSGDLTTTEHVQIRFDGAYDKDTTGDVITLKIQEVIAALDLVADGTGIKAAMEGAGGTF